MLPNHSSSDARKRTVITLALLLVINTGVAHILTNQVVSVSAQGAQVKDEQVVAPAEDELVPVEDGADGHDAARSITIYTVKSGDTISGIAQKFGITTGTIYAANDLTKNQILKVGQELVILPITGIQYKVKSGDTISGIAKKFDVSAADILDFNGIDDPDEIKMGVELIIPNAEPLVATNAKPTSKPSSASSGSSASGSASADSMPIPLINPVPGSILTQGLHAINAVDLGAPTGTPVVAAAKGTVIVAKNNDAYNGGFGNFVVISHGDGVQTLYAHMSKVSVNVGDSVDQGEQLGTVGSTGKSTGPHTHFEVHGEAQPFAHDKKGTRY